MRRPAIPAALAALALGLTACGGGEDTQSRLDPSESTGASAGLRETPSATGTASATASVSPEASGETPAVTAPPVETPSPTPPPDAPVAQAPPAAEQAPRDYDEYVSPGNPGGYIEVDAWAENGEPGAWTEYDANGNAIGAAIGPAPADSGGPGGDYSDDWLEEGSDWSEGWDGWLGDLEQETGQDLFSEEWEAWFVCGTEVQEQHMDAYPGQGATEAELDDYYAIDVSALEAEQCGPEPA